jgi:cbb3-type cytochrome oxidase maturation protein
MELTWIAIAASLVMGAAGLLVFVWSVRAHMFTNFEDVKYQVFWSDADEAAGTTPAKEQQHDSSKNK